MKNIIQQISAQAMRGSSILGLIVCAWCISAQAQTTTFTYQGRLTASSAAASGTFDLEFKLFDAGGTQIGASQTKEDVVVTNGIFTVQLDADLFEANSFDGGERLLEIGVRRGTETGAFTTLTPRQPITSAPYAIRALEATSADTALNATSATNATNAEKLGGLAAEEYATNISNAFVRNQTVGRQTAAFDIFGTGTADIFNVTTQFSIDNERVLSAPGTTNTFVGRSAGLSYTTGGSNSFFGVSAGQATTSGFNNSFFGVDTGRNNTADNNAFFGRSTGFDTTTGGSNSFFGVDAGRFNTTGARNAFVGNNAGGANTTGGNNVALGDNANFAANNLNFAAAIGSGASVSASDTIVLGKVAGTYNGVTRIADAVQIPGNLSVSGTLNANGANLTNLNASNITSGTLNDAQLSNNVARRNTANTFTGDQTVNGTLSGTTVNSTTQYNIGGSRVLSVAGADNLFAGVNAGRVNTGFSNSFIGAVAGNNNTTGSNNSFVGVGAGVFNGAGSDNSFVGSFAGSSNTTGSNNTIIGKGANVDSGALSYAAALGSGATVSTSNTIVLGRADGSDKVRIFGLGAAGSTSLCRNANNEISTCTAGNLTEKSLVEQNTAMANALREQKEQNERQQREIDELKQIVCRIKPDAEVCKMENK